MLLGCRMLKDVASVNSFEADVQVSWTESDATEVYFQLIDLNLDTSNLYRPPGRRFVPAAGATLSVELENIDDAKKVTRLAIQPFAQDGSIWKVQILPTDPCRGTPQLRLTLTEGTKVTRGLVKQGIKIWPKANLTVYP